MSIDIIGDVKADRVYCAGSFTKFLTTYVCLSLLAEHYVLTDILEDVNFFDNLCQNAESQTFLHLFQKQLGRQFSLHDICSYYAGLPYTFDLSIEELQAVEEGEPFKHQSIPDEKMFLDRCKNNIIPIYPPHGKFHYSELCIIFLGYLIEKVYDLKIESLFQRFIIDRFVLRASTFSRKRIPGVFIEDLSPKYDYPSIAILDHGYFCYSNGFYTTLTDMKTLLEGMLDAPIFKLMTNMNLARAASPHILNGLTVEIRLVDDDIIYGYEGLSFSGCNIWAYSTQKKKGYVTTCNSEEDAYTIIYDQHLGYKQFDVVPEYTQTLYKNFIKTYKNPVEKKDFPLDYQGYYHRVNINESVLTDLFEVGKDFIVIRNPQEIRYPTIFANGYYAVLGRDGLQGTTINLYEAGSGNRYMMFDGTLYRKIH